MTIHPTAIIDPAAELDDDVEVQAYSIIGPQIRIGRGTIIGPHCVLAGRTEIGADNRFYSGAQIGVLCQDLKHKEGMIGRTRIGDRNVFREHMSLSASTMEGDGDEGRVTSIGNDCMFMTCSHVGHDSHLGDNIVMSNQCTLGGHVNIGDNAILGGLSAVHQECDVGTLAFVGGMSRVTKDVPPYMIVEGNPTRCIGPNAIGLQRNGFSSETRDQIKKMYKTLYRSDLNTSQALDAIESTLDVSEERDRLLAFVRDSARGIVK